MDLFKLVGSIFIKNTDANSQIDNTTKKAENMATKIGSAIQTAGSKITGVGKALAPVSAVMAGALTASVKGASDFTDGMAKMSTLFNTSKTSVSDLSKEFITLSNKTGLSATELAEAGYQALSAGIDVDNSVGFVETAGNLAKAGFTSTSTAVDVLTTAINAYGLKQEEAGAISNKLVRTQNLGKTTVDELASSMGKIIPTASSMNVNIDNLTAGYVGLTKQGIATAEATTYMNSMMNEMGDSGTTVGKIIKEKTGKSFQECMQSGMSLADVLKVLQDDAKESGTNFNELWGSAEAGKAGIALLNGGVDEFNSTVETMASDTDDVGEALDKLNTPSVKAKKALNQIKNSGIELGTAFMGALLPTFEKVVGGIEKVTTWFSNLDEGTKTTIATVMGIVAVASPVLIGIGTFVTKIGGLITTIGTLSGSLGGVAGVIGAITSPVGLAVGAIVGLIAIFVALYKTNEDFRNTVNQCWSQIKQTISGVIDAIKSLISAFINLVKQMWNAWGADIVNVVQNAFTYLTTIVNSALNVIKAIIQTVTALIKGDWTGVWNGIKAILSAVWEGIKATVQAGINLIKSIIQLGLNVIKTVFSVVWSAIKSLVTTVMNAIKSVITSVWNAIKSAITSVLNAIKSVISSVWNAIKSTISSILNGIKSTFSSVWNGIKSTVSSAVNGVKSTISSGLNGALSTVSNVLGNIKSKFVSIFNNVKSTVANAISNIRSKFNFSWSLPKLKLPHISISGGFSLVPPKVPSFGISWYKKAMDEPYMFTKPTIFDYSSATGQAKGAGEAGDEMMYGRQNLMNDIGAVMSAQNNIVVEALDELFGKLFSMLEQYFPEFTKEMVLDTGVLVTELAPKMDTELGKIMNHKGRGN